ncbi:ATP-grasp domain-containing protein [Symbioplanes lichenis]|uniref:ATP-grasp domain-containing protein n=1 Tax=Symbioplanes lichenis TaxID=1629072 RepID=UPI00273962E2|nr:ATP-grasp domain-containing protein [Actinoplanes lichenis]
MGNNHGYLLLLGATMTLRERAVVAALRHFPGPIAALSPTRSTKSGKFFDFIVPGVPSDPESALAAVRAFERETGAAPVGIVPFVDGNLMAGLRLAEHYGLPFLSRRAVEDSSINKNLMKDRLVAAGVATPRCRVVDGVPDVARAVDEFGLPSVIKPCAFGGSLGVRLIRNREEIDEAYAYVRQIIDETAATFSVRNRAVQVEEFCPLSDEVSVEVLNHGEARSVLAVVDKSLGRAPYFAEVGHLAPSRYSGREDVRELAVAACAAIGLDRGLAHVEIRVEDGKAPQVIEVGARTAGGGIMDVVERVIGISPYALHILSYLDRLELPLPQPRPTGTAAIATLKAPGGRITGIRTPASVDPAVSNYEVTVAPGHVSSEVSANYLNREGYVELFWPAAGPAAVPPGEHLDIAAGLAAQIFDVEVPGADG